MQRPLTTRNDQATRPAISVPPAAARVERHMHARAEGSTVRRVCSDPGALNSCMPYKRSEARHHDGPLEQPCRARLGGATARHTGTCSRRLILHRNCQDVWRVHSPAVWRWCERYGLGPYGRSKDIGSIDCRVEEKFEGTQSRRLTATRRTPLEWRRCSPFQRCPEGSASCSLTRAPLHTVR